jgi:predicted nucleic acid-binding Zn ribbon protein
MENGRHCERCGRPLGGRQERFCSERCQQYWAHTWRQRDRRTARVRDVALILRRCSALMAAYGDPREIGWDQWLENRSAVQ